MAFEETPPQKTTTFTGIIIVVAVVLFLAILLFVFRDPIAKKIAEWRNGGAQVAGTQQVLPKISPAPSTPTPTATVAPTTTPVKVATTRTLTDPTGKLPKSGPDDLPLAVAGIGALASGLTAGRFALAKRNLRKQSRSIDIV